MYVKLLNHITELFSGKTKPSGMTIEIHKCIASQIREFDVMLSSITSHAMGSFGVDSRCVTELKKLTEQIVRAKKALEGAMWKEHCHLNVDGKSFNMTEHNRQLLGVYF